MVHAVNERISGVFEERGAHLPRWLRPASAVLFLGVAVGLTTFGLVDLIAKGYGTMTWVFMAVYVVPVLTLGVWTLVRDTRSGGAGREEPSSG